MANPVNYTVTNLPVNVNSNSNWSEGVTTYVKMELIPSLGYTITKENLTIGGVAAANTSVGISGVPFETNDEVAEWNILNSGYIFPQGVIAVYMLNTAINYDTDLNVPIYKVEVYAVLDPLYPIMTQDVNIVLDIDGDAVELTAPVVIPASSFTITARLQDGANASIYSALPAGVNAGATYNSMFSPQSYSVNQIVSISYATDGIYEASVICNPASGATTSSQLMSVNNQSPNTAWFWIVPNDGYTVSRDNFYPATTTVTGLPTVGSGFVVGYDNLYGQYYDIYGNVSPGGSTTLSAETYAANIQGVTVPSVTNGPQVNLVGSFPQGTYNFTGYDNPVIEYGGVLTNINSLSNYGSSMSTVNQLLLLDTAGSPVETDGSTLGSYPFNLDGQDFVNGVPPNTYCPSDWSTNAVLIMLDGISTFIPGENPPNIVIDIYGQAMLDDGSECLDVTINIEEPQ